MKIMKFSMYIKVSLVLLCLPMLLASGCTSLGSAKPESAVYTKQKMQETRQQKVNTHIKRVKKTYEKLHINQDVKTSNLRQMYGVSYVRFTNISNPIHNDVYQKNADVARAAAKRSYVTKRQNKARKPEKRQPSNFIAHETKPKKRRSSNVIDNENWLFKNRGRYAIQHTSTTTNIRAKKYSRNFSDRTGNPAYVFKALYDEGAPWYIVLSGQYPTFGKAKAQAKILGVTKPWIRRTAQLRINRCASKERLRQYGTDIFKFCGIKLK